ncbi:MAG: hypothetical protein LIR50_01130 [Bacillota bacterium]|nr:hypothetical protein [Bacillota bacterium]
MSNMNYCRFHNTQIDIQECIEALIDREISSNEEKKAAKNMLINFLDFCIDEEIIEEYDEEKIKEIINECER